MGVGISDPSKIREKLSETEKNIYDMVYSQGELTADDISRRLDMDSGRVNGIVAVMEMKGVVFSAMGKIFIAKYKKYTYNQILEVKVKFKGGVFMASAKKIL